MRPFLGGEYNSCRSCAKRWICESVGFRCKAGVPFGINSLYLVIPILFWSIHGWLVGWLVGLSIGDVTIQLALFFYYMNS